MRLSSADIWQFMCNKDTLNLLSATRLTRNKMRFLINPMKVIMEDRSEAD